MTSPRRKQLIRSIAIWGAFLFVILVAALWVFAHYGARGRVDKYTADLRRRGERLSISDFSLPLMTNGTPRFDHLISVVQRLHPTFVDVSKIDVVDYTQPGCAPVYSRNKNVIFDKRKSATWDGLERQLAQNWELLTELERTLSRPEPDYDWRATNTFVRIDRSVIEKRSAAFWLTAEALLAAHNRNSSGATRNLLTLISLAQFHRKSPLLVDQIMRSAFADRACQVTWDLLHSCNLTEPELRNIQEGLQKVELFDAFVNSVQFERTIDTEYYKAVRSGETNILFWMSQMPRYEGATMTTIWRYFVAEEDEMFYLHETQKQLDHIRTFANGKSWKTAHELFSHGEVERSLGAIDKATHSLGTLLLDHVGTATRTVVRSETQKQMTITAIALARYRLRYGKNASTLKALVPEFLNSEPVDYMNHQPLHYRIEPNHGFVLYSCGEDGRDDGGDVRATDGSTKVIDLWSGRDAVWPLAQAE